MQNLVLGLGPSYCLVNKFFDGSEVWVSDEAEDFIVFDQGGDVGSRNAIFV